MNRGAYVRIRQRAAVRVAPLQRHAHANATEPPSAPAPTTTSTRGWLGARSRWSSLAPAATREHFSLSLSHTGLTRTLHRFISFLSALSHAQARPAGRCTTTAAARRPRRATRRARRRSARRPRRRRGGRPTTGPCRTTSTASTTRTSSPSRSRATHAATRRRRGSTRPRPPRRSRESDGRAAAAPSPSRGLDPSRDAPPRPLRRRRAIPLFSLGRSFGSRACCRGPSQRNETVCALRRGSRRAATPPRAGTRRGARRSAATGFRR